MNYMDCGLIKKKPGVSLAKLAVLTGELTGTQRRWPSDQGRAVRIGSGGVLAGGDGSRASGGGTSPERRRASALEGLEARG